VCQDLGNADWREFRYRSENHDLDGKRRRLVAICSACGHPHVFDEGQWKLDQSQIGTAKFMVLFSPSSFFFYRVREFADFEKARR
jgi:hypothetical protein